MQAAFQFIIKVFNGVKVRASKLTLTDHVFMDLALY